MNSIEVNLDLLRELARRAFQALPESVNEYYFRGDPAYYEKQLLGWLRNEQHPAGPRGPIGFAISTRMQPSLRQHIVRLPALRQLRGQDPSQ